MKKYFQVFKLTLEEYFIYRLNFVLWRFRNFISFLASLIFWLAVYGSKTSLLGYQKTQIITYVIGAAFLRGVVLSSRSEDLAGQIRSGELNKLLLKPFKITGMWFARDLADKSLNIGFAVFEIVLATQILGLKLFVPSNAAIYLVFSFLTVLSLLLYFFISFFLSVLAFWTEDVWATRWLFGIIFLEFLAGAYFPIDILPAPITRVIYLTPFPYLIFFPLKVWLGQVPISNSVGVLANGLIWLIFFYLFSAFLWHKGVKKFGAYGG